MEPALSSSKGTGRNRTVQQEDHQDGANQQGSQSPLCSGYKESLGGDPMKLQTESPLLRAETVLRPKKSFRTEQRTLSLWFYPDGSAAN